MALGMDNFKQRVRKMTKESFIELTGEEKPKSNNDSPIYNESRKRTNRNKHRDYDSYASAMYKRR